MILKKLKGKIIKLVLVSFVCLNTYSSFALNEITEKKYKTFDGKIFGIKDNAILHEKVQKNVDLLLEVFKKEIEEIEQQKTSVIKNRNRDCDIKWLGRESWRQKELYKKYDDCLYQCMKKLEEKGIDIEITLKQHCGTFTVNKK